MGPPSQNPNSKFSYHFVVDKVMRKPRFRWDYWKFLAVMAKNAEQSMTMVYLLLRFYPSFLSKLDLIIISSFLIQNKLSNEWSTILVVQIFLWELKKNCLKNLRKRNLCVFRARNLRRFRFCTENRNSQSEHDWLLRTAKNKDQSFSLLSQA